MEKSSEQMKASQQVIRKEGGLRTMPFIIANETFEKVAGFGLHVNIIFYLINEYHLDPATGASILFLWSAISNFMPIIGAFVSDSYLGRFRVIAYGTVISLLGMVLLWLTTILPQARPPHCKMYVENCESSKPGQLMLLYSSFALMSIGAGGIRPCSLVFGADQINNHDNPKNEKILQSFFNWYYASVGLSIMISVTIIVYIQDKKGWLVGFGIPVGLMLFSTVMFFLGSFLNVKVKASKSLFTDFAQVITVTWKNRQLPLPPKYSDRWYFQKGSKLVVPTDKLRFLNKACIIRNFDKDLDSAGLAVDPWSLCTVRKIEELKALIKVLPIWSTGIIIAVTVSQHSFPVLQASTMDRNLISNFKIPSSSFGVFAILTMTIWVAIYDRIVVPMLSKFTKQKRGLSLQQRMGIGLALSCLATSVAAQVERNRRNNAIREGLLDNPKAVVNMSAMWLVPQYCLTGLAEAFNSIGQIEFYYSQVPKSMSSIGVALLALGMAVGNLVATLMVKVVDNATKRGGKVSWVSENLNKGHYDYYYGILTILGVVNLFYYMMCSWAYGNGEDIETWDEGEDKHEEEKHQPSSSLMIFSF
ncbi:Protein NRT1/ PTR FAMILY 1.2 like [Quillaja saponaria]|uniref:Protein NRT1/ PTR FAMILY 1.2 like n=1 Tax=Quillaja saponaria TaxID=32244 RepID=A0AAD7Q2V9_QUISA|nr:Protein NRT1/ PTR FAMILY 1.2 like [Quillaja saponaria]